MSRGQNCSYTKPNIIPNNSLIFRIIWSLETNRYFNIFKSMIICNNMNFRRHHNIFSDNSIVRNNTIFPNTTKITYLQIFTISKICMSINSRYFSTTLKDSLTAKDSKRIEIFTYTRKIRTRKMLCKTIIKKQK